MDLDGDGVIRPREMLYFYEEQLRRLEGWNQEPVQFEDLLCQLHDMLTPGKEGAFTLRWGHGWGHELHLYEGLNVMFVFRG